MFRANLNQPKFTKALYNRADSGLRRAHHCGQLFVDNLLINADAVQVLLTQFACQVQEHLA